MKIQLNLFIIAAAAVASLGIWSCKKDMSADAPANHLMSVAPAGVVEFPAKGGSVTLTVTTELTWTATVTSTAPADDPSWLAVTPQGVGSGEITVAVAANTTGTKRAATIVVSNNSPADEVTIIVSQAGVVSSNGDWCL